MDISRHIPNPKPPGWDELEKELQQLAKKYPLDDIEWCAQVLLAGRADAKVFEALRPILDEFTAIKCMHICHHSEDGESGSFVVYLEMEEGAKPNRKLAEAKKWIAEILSKGPSFHGIADPIEFVSKKKFDLIAERVGDTKILDRTTI